MKSALEIMETIESKFKLYDREEYEYYKDKFEFVKSALRDGKEFDNMSDDDKASDALYLLNQGIEGMKRAFALKDWSKVDKIKPISVMFLMLDYQENSSKLLNHVKTYDKKGSNE